MDRPDIIPVRSSEVMRRCKIDITQWRNADDVQRETWRNVARLQIVEESKTTGATLNDRVGSSETRLIQAESEIESLHARLSSASAAIASYQSALTECNNAITALTSRVRKLEEPRP